jgi:hypothetical protein
MKLNDGTEIDNYNIENLARLSNKLNSERLLKLRAIEQKQLEIVKLQDEILQIQNDAMALGDDVIAISKKLIDERDKARVNN